MAQIVDHEERRRGIVEAAKRLILAGGFSAATMRTIATEAGYANGALKYYFPAGKEAIVAAAFESMLGEIESRASTPPDGDALVALRWYLRSWFPVSADEIPTGRLLVELWGYTVSSEPLARLYAEHLTRWKGQIVERFDLAATEGAIVARSYGEIADEYLSFLMGTVVMNLMFPAGEHLSDIDGYLDELLARLRTA